MSQKEDIRVLGQERASNMLPLGQERICTGFARGLKLWYHIMIPKCPLSTVRYDLKPNSSQSSHPAPGGMNKDFLCV